MGSTHKSVKVLIISVQEMYSKCLPFHIYEQLISVFAHCA